MGGGVAVALNYDNVDVNVDGNGGNVDNNKFIAVDEDEFVDVFDDDNNDNKVEAVAVRNNKCQHETMLSDEDKDKETGVNEDDDKEEGRIVCVRLAEKSK
jgi:hypothetical protein